MMDAAPSAESSRAGLVLTLEDLYFLISALKLARLENLKTTEHSLALMLMLAQTMGATLIAKWKEVGNVLEGTVKASILALRYAVMDIA